MQCPNCNYKLVLLKNRPKYKCALCSKLYSQKFIENIEFQKYNQLQKQLDISNYNIKRKQELKQIRDIKKHLKYLFNGIPNYLNKKLYYNQNKAKIKLKNKEYRIKHRENKRIKDREYYNKNKYIINLRAKLRRQNNPEYYNKKKLEWRNKNIQIMRLYGMIQYYRRKQKALALTLIKNNSYKPSNTNIFPSVPTCSLSYLLYL